MSEIEVLDLILNQIGDLRVPVREDELMNQIKVIRRNVIELRKAIASAIEREEQIENERSRATQDDGTSKPTDELFADDLKGETETDVLC